MPRVYSSCFYDRSSLARIQKQSIFLAYLLSPLLLLSSQSDKAAHGLSINNKRNLTKPSYLDRKAILSDNHLRKAAFLLHLRSFICEVWLVIF